MSGHFEHGAWVETRPDETITFENCKIKLDNNPETEFVCCSISLKPTYDDVVDSLMYIYDSIKDISQPITVTGTFEDHI